MRISDRGLPTNEIRPKLEKTFCGHRDGDGRTHLSSNPSKDSQMGPVRQNAIQRTVRSVHMCTAVCTIVAHNIAQNKYDNFPSYPPDSSVNL